MNFRNIFNGLILIILIENTGTKGMKLKPEFGILDSEVLWPAGDTSYLFSSANFSEDFKNFNFLGSESLKQTINVIFFHSVIGVIERIPYEIFDQFPTLNGIILTESLMPIVNSRIFNNSNFEKMQKLNLAGNQIERIDRDAFNHMKNLKWLRLHGNKLTSISYNIFKYNLQLEYIDLDSNEINSVNPQLFVNLKSLKILDFGSNECGNFTLGCEACQIGIEEINENFQQTCYKHYLGPPQETDDSSDELQIIPNNKMERIKHLEETVDRQSSEFESLKQELIAKNSKLEADLADLRQKIQNMKEESNEMKKEILTIFNLLVAH